MRVRNRRSVRQKNNRQSSIKLIVVVLLLMILFLLLLFYFKSHISNVVNGKVTDDLIYQDKVLNQPELKPKEAPKRPSEAQEEGAEYSLKDQEYLNNLIRNK